MCNRTLAARLVAREEALRHNILLDRVPTRLPRGSETWKMLEHPSPSLSASYRSSSSGSSQ